MTALGLAHSMVTRVKDHQDWQTWILGALWSVLFLLVTFGYQSISTEISRNREMIMELQRTGAMPVREQLASHSARLEGLEKATEQNISDHARIMTELSIIRESVTKRR